MRTDPKLVNSALSLLNEWGWEEGLERLRAKIEAADESQRAELQFFVGWVAGERGAHAEALEQFRAVEQLPRLASWALVGQAYMALRENDYARARELADRAASEGEQGDAVLRATVAHCRGAIFYKEGKTDLALTQLRQALDLFGQGHFGTGRVYDSFGACYAARNNFHAAREFYRQALKLKKEFDDEAGVALTHGQLGRLYMEWGHLPKAEEHFTEDLEIARRIRDGRGEAQMYNYLGLVALAKGEPEEAIAWIEQGADLGEKMGWVVPEGFARKDLAIAYARAGRVADAEAEARRAQELFTRAEFGEGRAHTGRAWGLVYRAQARLEGSEQASLYEESERSLRAALAWFDKHGEHAEATRTQLEVARTLRARGKAMPLVTRELLNALDRAENCWRDALVREIESELKEVNEVAYLRRVCRRARGRDVRADTSSLISGERDDASVLFLDVQGSTEFARTQDPEIVMMTLNQMMMTFASVLARHEASVTAYLGDGFMALLRGVDHPKRAVRAGLDLVGALEEFNGPRRLLGLNPFNVRVGISSGAVFVGNVGTYDKMDYTAIGTTANRAARLQGEGKPGVPCVSRSTYEQVRDNFVFGDDSPRPVKLKGLEEVEEAWDVSGERER